MTREKAGVWLVAAISIISFVAAFIPVVKGEGPSVMFLGVGTLWLVITIAAVKRSRIGKED